MHLCMRGVVPKAHAVTAGIEPARYARDGWCALTRARERRRPHPAARGNSSGQQAAAEPLEGLRAARQRGRLGLPGTELCARQCAPMVTVHVQ
jgi:hypothetical protein